VFVSPLKQFRAVDLSLAFNPIGIFTDGRPFNTGGLDAGGHAYSASQLGSAVIWRGVSFQLGPPNAPNTVSCSGQTLPLPHGKFGSLMMLAAGVNSNHESQEFRVHYSDGSEGIFKQSISDWWYPQPFAREYTAVSMAYRNRE
jgi:hypothetical protein